MNKPQMQQKLKNYILHNFETATAYAEMRGVSVQFVSSVVNGTKEPTKQILDDLGLTRNRHVTISYEEE